MTEEMQLRQWVVQSAIEIVGKENVCPPDFGDSRIQEFWRIAADWGKGASEESLPDRKRQMLNHSEWYRKQAQKFSDFHAKRGR